MIRIRHTSILVFAIALSGCVLSPFDNSKGSFSCPAPEGAACQSVSTTYGVATGTLPTKPTEVPKTPHSSSAPSAKLPSSPTTTLTGFQGRPDGVYQLSDAQLRSPVRHTRLWVRDYVDADGDLVTAYRVYMVRDMGQWRIGVVHKAGQEQYAPVRAATVEAPAAGVSQEIAEAPSAARAKASNVGPR